MLHCEDYLHKLMMMSACKPNKDMVVRFSGVNQQFSCYFLCSPSSSQPFGEKKTINVDKNSQER